ncbi:hypothetical protein EXIGLDRAFT_839334 [Exidia glandulosa HHB12029]|uniref:Uncharacterized protein n=1 Tax=Exidia glandulosa HHB12029 TaxID=1314781 RepID=A0A165F3H0_EXIGL|nr:hypothetical protein EXIGLDRAFT_839334 [Exidia glandulosa HHB12029]
MSSPPVFALGSPISLTAPPLPRPQGHASQPRTRRRAHAEQHETRCERRAALKQVPRRKHCNKPGCCFWVSGNPDRTCWSLLDRPGGHHQDAVSHPRRSRRTPKQLPKLCIHKPVRLATPPPSSEETDDFSPFSLARPSSSTVFSMFNLPCTPVSAPAPHIPSESPLELPPFPFVREFPSTPVTPKSSATRALF